MITQSYKIDMTSGAVPIRIKVSQYDVGVRQLVFQLYNLGQALTSSNIGSVSAIVEGTKPDEKGFAYDCTTSFTSEGCFVTVQITEQMTACAGDVVCELVLQANNVRIGSANFILECERAALNDQTDISDTEIPAIIDAGRQYAEAAEDAAERAEAAAAEMNGGAALGKYTYLLSPSNTVETDIDLQRDPKEGDRIQVYFETRVDNPAYLTTFDHGVGVTVSLGSSAPSYLEGMVLFEYQTDGPTAYKWAVIYMDEDATGAGSLANLTDTTITSPTAGQPLTYDATSSKWGNGGIIPTANGGTGNASGYIRTGTSSPAGTAATIEGTSNVGSGANSHVEGSYNQTGANATNSHVGGYANESSYANQTVVGVANSNKSDTYFEVGNGTKNGQHKNAFEVYSNGNAAVQNNLTVGGNISTSGSVSDANGTLNAVVANPSGSAAAGDLTKLQVGSSIYSIPSGGSGDTVSKTRYLVSYSSGWSSSPNSDGYYSKTIVLSPSIKSSPNVYIAGNSDINQPTDTHKAMYASLERCVLAMSGTSLILYSKTTPTSSFYIWVEGEEGTASINYVGNIIQPNGESSGGSGVLTPFTLIQNDRLSNVQGGYRVDGDIVTVDLFARLLVEPANTIVFPDLVTSGMDSRIVGLPVPKYRTNVYMQLLYLTYNSGDNEYIAYANGFAIIDSYPEDSTSFTHLVFGKYSALNLSQQNIYIRCYGTYQKQ